MTNAIDFILLSNNVFDQTNRGVNNRIIYVAAEKVLIEFNIQLNKYNSTKKIRTRRKFILKGELLKNIYLRL